MIQRNREQRRPCDVLAVSADERTQHEDGEGGEDECVKMDGVVQMRDVVRLHLPIEQPREEPKERHQDEHRARQCMQQQFAEPCLQRLILVLLDWPPDSQRWARGSGLRARDADHGLQRSGLKVSSE